MPATSSRSATHRLVADFAGDGWDLYRSLRQINPAPFASLPALRRACRWCLPRRSSLRPSNAHEGRAESPTDQRHAPAAGPLPATGCAASAKSCWHRRSDRAENIMIVDLVRNDFGRVCAVDSIGGSGNWMANEAEVFPGRAEMVSTVRGRLDHGRVLRLENCFRACFPARLDDRRSEDRSRCRSSKPSSRANAASTRAASATLDVGGGMDWSVVIRSFVLAQGRCYSRRGRRGRRRLGSALRSIAESMHKAQALLDALALQRGRSPCRHEAADPSITYDSFVYNLAQAFRLARRRRERRAQRCLDAWASVRAFAPQALGSDLARSWPIRRMHRYFGICAQVVRELGASVPPGLPLGHQGIVHALGGRISAQQVMHGKSSRSLHDGPGRAGGGLPSGFCRNALPLARGGSGAAAGRAARGARG